MGGVHIEEVPYKLLTGRLNELRKKGYRFYIVEWIRNTDILKLRTWHRKQDRIRV